MTMPVQLISGMVARVLNSREVALNVGANDRVQVGMVFKILSQTGSEITDPATEETLGSIELEKTRVKVTRVYDRISVAETYLTRRVNVGGSGFGLGLSANLFAPPKWETRYETFEIDENTKLELDEAEAYVKRGDPVVQYIET